MNLLYADCFTGTGIDTISNMVRWPIPLLCALLLLQSLPAQNRQRTRPSERLPAYFKAFKAHQETEGLTRAVFKNGLTVIVEEYPSTPLVAVVTLVKLGNTPEGLDSELVAEFVGQIFREKINSFGGFGEVRSGISESLFASVVPSEKILEALESHVDLFTPRSYDAEELKFLADGLQRSREHRWKVQPTKESLVQNFYLASETPAREVPTAERYREFYRAYYQPGNAIVVVSGLGRNEQVLSELVELFSERSFPKGVETAGVRNVQARTDYGFSYHHLRGEVVKPLIVLGYPVPGLEHKDYAVVKLLEYVLGKGNAALLNCSHDEEKANPFLAQVSLEKRRGGELFLILLVPEVDDIDKSLVRPLALLEALKKAELPQVLLDRAKALMLTDYYEALSRLDQRAYSLAFAEAAGEVETRNRLPRILAEISTQDVQDVVARYFLSDRLTMVEFLPKSAEERTFTSESLGETLGILVPGEIQNQISVFEVFRSDSLESSFEPPKFEPSYSETELKRTSILRGPEIYLKEEHSLPLVHLGFFFPGGRINEVASNAGITRLMLQAVLQNYVRRGGLLTTSRLEAKGVRIELVDEPDFFGVQAVVLSSEVNDGIWELLRWLRAPEIEEVDIEVARAELLRRMTLEPTNRLLDSAKRAVYGDHPYGYSSSQTEINLGSLAADSVVAWKDKYLDKVNPHILALGDVPGTAFISGLVSELSDRQYRVGTTFEKKVSYPDEASLPRLVSDPEQGRAIMVYPGPEEGSDFSEMLDVALLILGSPQGLVRQSLRYDRRLVNGLQLFREAGVGGGAIYIAVEAPSSNLENGLKEIRNQLNQFSEKSVPESLFLDALVSRLTEHHFRRQVRSEYLFEVMRAILAKEPPDYGARYILNVRQLRIGEIVFAVQRFMGEEH